MNQQDINQAPLRPLGDRILIVISLTIATMYFLLTIYGVFKLFK